MRPNRPQPVRVLFIDHVPRLSGAEQSLLDLVAGLAQGPVEPVVVLPNDGPLAADLRAHGVLVRMVPMSRRMLETSRTTLARRPFVALAQVAAFLGAGWRLFRLVREIRPQIVHTNTLKSHLLAILPCRAARVPLVWHLRDILPEGWLRSAVVRCARFASVVIVPSRAVADAFRGNRAVYRKLRLIPNGIRVQDFQDAKRDRSLREMMGVDRSDVVVGIVGRIAPWKGQDVFLHAAGMIARRHPRAHFAIIGAPLFGDDAAFEGALLQGVAQMGLEGRVTFLGWQPAPEAMASLDVVVHASHEPEPFGRAIVEAMAAGKPVVAADGGAVREILPPSAGFIVPPGRPELLADALDRLLAEPKLRKRMGEAGGAIADSFFPVARTIQSVAVLYRALGAAAQKRRARRQIRPQRAAKRWSLRRHRTAPRPRPRVPDQPMRWPTIEPEPTRRVALEQPAEDRFEPGAGPAPRRAKRVPAYPVASSHTVAIARPMPVSEPFSDELPDDPSHAERPVAVAEHRPLPVSGGQSVAVLAPPMMAPVLAPEPFVAPEPQARPLRAVPRSPHYIPKPLYDLAKRALDVALASAALILGAPLWMLVAVLIKLESPGPVFFRGTVFGKGCEPFTYFKFRSMRTDGCDAAHRSFIARYVRENGGHDHNGRTVYKLVADERVTAVGGWIRRLSIDEIPQLINVLRGEMSIVGPRPPLDYEYELYDERMKGRMCVLPGITGLQQVAARHDAPFEEKLQLDSEYVRRRSMATDLGIILRTIPAAFRGH